MLCRLVSGQFVVMLISRVGLVPDLDSFSGDADGALGVNFVFSTRLWAEGLGCVRWLL